MNATEILKQHKVKKTTPRISIIQALQQNEHPLSEAEIKEMLGDLYDRITFYRNAQTLMEAGILHRIIIDNIHIKYALNKCEKDHCHHTNHVHFYCRKCDEVSCLKEIEIKSKVPKGYVPEEVDVLIRGICPLCQIGR